MDDEDEWGPWIEWACHFGTPENVHIGDWARCIGLGRDVTSPVKTLNPRSWALVDRFRVRKPKGLSILEKLIADVPVEQVSKETVK